MPEGGSVPYPFLSLSLGVVELSGVEVPVVAREVVLSLPVVVARDALLAELTDFFLKIFRTYVQICV